MQHLEVRYFYPIMLSVFVLGEDSSGNNHLCIHSHKGFLTRNGLEERWVFFLG